MKKKILAFVLAICLIMPCMFTMVGCSGSASGSTGAYVFDKFELNTSKMTESEIAKVDMDKVSEYIAQEMGSASFEFLSSSRVVYTNKAATSSTGDWICCDCSYSIKNGKYEIICSSGMNYLYCESHYEKIYGDLISTETSLYEYELSAQKSGGNLVVYGNIFYPASAELIYYFKPAKNIHNIFTQDGVTYLEAPNSSNEVWVAGYDHDDIRETIEIAQEIDGKTVTRIMEYAFYGNLTVKNVSMPNSIKKIDRTAFRCCTSLASINLSTALEEIDIEAFSNCFDLTSIEIPSGVKKLEHDTFYQCEKLENVTFNEGLEWLDGAFKKCKNLGTIVLPSSLRKLTNDEFVGSIINSLYIPEYVETFDLEITFFSGNKYDGTLIKELILTAEEQLEQARALSVTKNMATIYLKDGIYSEDSISRAGKTFTKVETDKTGFMKFVVDTTTE